MAEKTTVVLGAGVTGLAAAWKLAEAGRQVELVEISGEVGGASRTFRWGEFLVDTGPHKIYTTLPGILDSVKELMGPELIEVPKQTSIFMQGRLIDYPFKMTQLLRRLSPVFGARLGLSWLAALASERSRPDLTYEDWIIKRFGRAMYDSTFAGLAQKIWSDPRKLSADLARRRIVTPGMLTLLKRVLLGHSDKQAPSPVFHYPKMGIGRMSERIRDRITAAGGKVWLGSTVERLTIEGGRVSGALLRTPEGSRMVPVDRFVSTIPMARLFELVDPAPPEEVLRAAKALRIRPVMLAMVAFDVPRLLRDIWIFFPDRRLLFNRISEQKGFSDAMGPADKTVICFDITAGHMPEAWDWEPSRVVERCLDDLRACGLYRGERVLKSEVFKIPSIYPVYDLNYRENLRTCLDWIDSVDNLYTTGRAGLFCYNNTDQCLDMGFRLAAHIESGEPRSKLRDLLAYFDSYEIVD